MNGCSASGSTLRRATHPVLTSQSIQLSHPTVLILLGNDLKKREWKIPVEEVAAAGGIQLSDCVSTMRNCFVLNCFANVLFSHSPGPSRAQSYCKHPLLPSFRGDAHRCFYNSGCSVKLGLGLDQIHHVHSCTAARKGTLWWQREQLTGQHSQKHTASFPGSP